MDTVETHEPTAPRAYTYDHIPNLRELLPTTGGVPGVLYAQISVANARRAQDEGWGAMHGNLAIYTISGPKGSVDCQLVCKGTPIPGQGSHSGARQCMVDESIYAATGIVHPLDGVHTRHEKVEEPKPKRGPGRPRKNPIPSTSTE